MLTELAELEYDVGMQELYSVREVAKQIGVSTETIRKHIKDGRFPGAYRSSPVRGAKWIIPVAAVEWFRRLSSVSGAE